MIKDFRPVLALSCVGLALAGCGEVEVIRTDTASVASPVMDAACLAELRQVTNSPDVRLIEAIPRGRSTLVKALVGGTGTWDCVVFEDGFVDEVVFTGNDSAGLP